VPGDQAGDGGPSAHARRRQDVGPADRSTTGLRHTSGRRGPHGEVAPSPRAQALARGVAPALRVVEHLGLWPRLFSTLGRLAPRPGDFGGYLPGEHDVVVATYEKSGTNWMLQIVHQVATLGHGRFGHVHDVAPWPDAPGGRPSVAVPLEAPTWREAPTGLRPVKTHLPRASTPLTEAGRYVLVIRDPKDVVVSSYHFVRGIALGPLMPSVSTWVELFLSEQGFAPSGGPWADHVAGWWRERHRPNVLALRYEELVADLPGGIGLVADLMGVDLDPDALERVRSHSTFEAMRAVGERFDLGPFTPFGSRQTRMVRRGAAGGSAELLTAEQRRRIDDHCESTLRRLGSDFPYAEVYRSGS
jgi:Sulfotransferase domain